MALVEQITNGQVTGNKSISNVENSRNSKATDKSATASTKDMFLQLLVAEMKYQDPLEPSDNSEYVQQMSTLSEVESVENVESSMLQLQSASLAGKYATVNDSEGNEVTGLVQYTTTKDGEPQVVIDGKTYSVENVEGVYDTDYYEGQMAVSSIQSLLEGISAAKMSTDDVSKVKKAASLYDSMSSYQQSLVPEATLNTLKSLRTIVEVAEKTAGSASADSTKEETETDTAEDTSAAEKTAEESTATAGTQEDSTSASEKTAEESTATAGAAEDTSAAKDSTTTAAGITDDKNAASENDSAAAES